MQNAEEEAQEEAAEEADEAQKHEESTALDEEIFDEDLGDLE